MKVQSRQLDKHLNELREDRVSNLHVLKIRIFDIGCSFEFFTTEGH
jgi:hypothetical protein